MFIHKRFLSSLSSSLCVRNGKERLYLKLISMAIIPVFTSVDEQSSVIRVEFVELLYELPMSNTCVASETTKTDK